MRHCLFALVSFLSISSLAHAEITDPGSRGVRFESSGRAVEIEVFDEGRCKTPCEMALAPGAYQMRVDGLRREFYVATRSDVIVVQPVRYPLLVLGVSLLAGGSTGLVFSAHWASPLDGGQRLRAGLGGLALVALATPLIIWSSASIEQGKRRRVGGAAPQPEQFILSVGLAHRGGDEELSSKLRLAASVAHRFSNSRLSIGAYGHLGAFADERAVGASMGPSFHLARLPIVSVAAGARLGLESRWVSSGADFERQAGREYSGLMQVSSQLRVEVPWPVKPTLNLDYEVTNYDGWSGRVVTGLSMSAVF